MAKSVEKLFEDHRTLSSGILRVQAFCFELKRTSGSHRIFMRSGLPDAINVQPHKGEVKPYQVVS